MAEYDGTLQFDTSIDTDAFIQGLQDLRGVTKTLLQGVCNVLEASCETMGTALADAISRNEGTTSAAATELAHGIQKALLASGDMTAAGKAVGGSLAGGIDAARGQVLTASDAIGSVAQTVLTGSTAQFYTLGQNAGQGYARGVASTLSLAITAATRLVYAASEAVKKAQDSNSPSKVFAQLGNDAIDGYILGLDEKTGELVRSAMAQNAALLETEALYLTEKKRLEEEAFDREYNAKIKNARNAREIEKIKQDYRLKAQEDGQKRYLDALKTAADRERKALEEHQANILKQYEDLYKKQEAFSEKLYAFGGLYEDYSFTFKGMGIGGDDLLIEGQRLADIAEQTRTLEGYADGLQRLKERGQLPEGFFESIRDLSVEEGLQFIDTLLGVSDEQFAQYIADLEKKKEVTQRIARELHVGDAEALADEIAKELAEAGLTIPAGFWDTGAESAKSFGAAFMEELQLQMAKIRGMVESFTASLAPQVAFSGAGINGSTVDNRSYSPTYNVQPSSGESTAAQLAALRSAELLQRLRFRG